MKALEKKIDKANVRMEKFSGIDEMVSFLERTPADAGFRDVVTGTHELSKRFNGAESYAEAREYIKKGVKCCKTLTHGTSAPKCILPR